MLQPHHYLSLIVTVRVNRRSSSGLRGSCRALLCVFGPFVVSLLAVVSTQSVQRLELLLSFVVYSRAPTFLILARSSFPQLEQQLSLPVSE